VIYGCGCCEKEGRDNEKKMVISCHNDGRDTVRNNQRDVSGSGVIEKLWFAGRLCPESAMGSPIMTKTCLSKYIVLSSPILLNLCVSI